jgi:hypothetical protein
MHRRPGKANNAGDAATDAADATKNIYKKYHFTYVYICIGIYVYVYGVHTMHS